MARLVIYSSGVVNQTVELTGQNIRIGRARGNDVVLFDPAQAVSRFHAELRCEAGRYILLDLNSANGTWVSDHRIQRIVLDKGMVAEIGDYRLVLEADPDETTAPPTYHVAVESEPAETPKAVSGTLVISALPSRQKPTAQASVPLEPTPSTRISPPRVSAPPVGSPAPVSPPAPPASARPAAIAPATPAPIPTLHAAPLPVPPAPDRPPARPSSFRPSATAAEPPPPPGRSGVRGGAESGARGAGGRSLAAGLARQPRALVVSVIALVILIVGVIGIIVGGEFLLSPPGGSGRQAEEQPPARQTAVARTPAEPPANQTPGAAESPVSMPPSAQPPPAPPAAPMPRPMDRSKDRVNPAPPTPATARPDSPAVVAGPTRRANESQTEFLMRAQRLEGTYNEAVAALRAKDFSGAITLFERLEKEQPGLLDVPARLAESREGLRESKRAAALASLATAIGAEQRGDFVEAQREYQRAIDFDPACGADDALRRVHAQMKTLGDAAFRRAKTYDAMGRTEDAIAQYERAIQLLPTDDPNRKVAKGRLDILRPSFIK